MSCIRVIATSVPVTVRLLSTMALLLVLIAVVVACTGENASKDKSSTVTAATDKPGVAQCPAGSTPDEPGPADQERPALDMSIWGAAMDTQSGRVVVFNSWYDQTWTFDVCSNTWEQAQPKAELNNEGPLLMAYDADDDLTIAVTESGVWSYSVESNTWTHLTDIVPTGEPTGVFQDDMTYDPVSGSVLLVRYYPSGMWAFDVEAKTWTEIDQGDVVPGDDAVTLGGSAASLLDFDVEADRLVLTLLGDMDRRATWTFDPRGRVWTRQDASPPAMYLGWVESGGEVAYDEAAGLTVALGSGVLATYSVADDEWTTVGTYPEDSPQNRSGHRLVYDPVNERTLVFGGSSLYDVWAYDLSNGTWLELVPGRAQ